MTMIPKADFETSKEGEEADEADEDFDPELVRMQTMATESKVCVASFCFQLLVAESTISV